MLQNLALILFTMQATEDPWGTITSMVIVVVVGVAVTLVMASALHRYYLLPYFFPTEMLVSRAVAMAITATSVAIGAGVLLAMIGVLTPAALLLLVAVVVISMALQLARAHRQERRTD